jgi:hypothetical protein
MLDALFFAGLSGVNRRSAVAETKSDQANAKASTARDAVEGLRADVEKLFMLTEALWSFLKTQHGYTDEDLVARLQAIDLQDGRLDGKNASQIKQPSSCPACSRPVLRRQAAAQCLYCGAELSLRPFTH